MPLAHQIPVDKRPTWKLTLNMLATCIQVATNIFSGGFDSCVMRNPPIDLDGISKDSKALARFEKDLSVIDFAMQSHR